MMSAIIALMVFVFRIIIRRKIYIKYIDVKRGIYERHEVYYILYYFPILRIKRKMP